MKAKNSTNAKICMRCQKGTVLTGNSAQYNAKSIDGTSICPGCKLEEIINLAKNNE